MSARRLGAVGTMVWDRIIHPASGGAAIERWGGMLYSLSALSATCGEDWSVEPMLKLGGDLADEALSVLHRLPCIVLDDAVRPVPEPMNRVELTYSDHATRGERLTGGVPSWEWDEIEPLLPRYDALYVNFISGFEMELETALRLRDAFSGPIYADLHSLFLGCPGASVRQRRVLPDWKEWVSCFDAVQMNQTELSLLAGSDDPTAFAATLLDLGPAMVVNTLGDRGARILARPGRLWGGGGGEDRLALEVATGADARPGDPTGCGDVWGAAFFMSLLRGVSVDRAAERAHAMAVRTVDTPSTEVLFERLRELSTAPSVS